MKSYVLDQGTIVIKLPDETLQLPPGATRIIHPKTKWKDPKLWGVKEPNLYFMATDLYIDDKLVDSCRNRFGFREFWIDGKNFILNGVKIKLRECATHIYYHPGRTSWTLEEYKNKPVEGARAEIESIQWANFNCTRMVHRPHPSFFYDIADELGHLVMSHMPIGFGKDHFNFQNQALQANTRRTIAGIVKKERNHPSIIIWEWENEGFPYGEEQITLDFANFYENCVMNVCNENDPTRPVKFGGDGDILGRAPDLRPSRGRSS